MAPPNGINPTTVKASCTALSLSAALIAVPMVGCKKSRRLVMRVFLAWLKKLKIDLKKKSVN
jgi:hypothetical protein